MTSRLAVLLLGVALAGCPGRTTAPDPTAPAPTPEPTPEPVTAAAPSGKDVLANALLGEQDLGDWSVRMGYDLGILKMLVLARPSDAHPVTLAALDPTAPGANADTMAAVFAGEEVKGEHPFGLLGYDHVMPRSAEVVDGRATLSFSWLRIDPDTAERQSGRGTAIQLACDASGLVQGRWMLLAAESPGTDHDPAAVTTLAQNLRVCGG